MRGKRHITSSLYQVIFLNFLLLLYFLAHLFFKLSSARVTQCYETGCAVYFYFGFNYRGINDPVQCYLQIEEEARDEILANGGSLSHHHGIGKLRKKWVTQTLSPTGVSMLRSVKLQVDPKNIMAAQNIYDLK